MFAYHLKSLFRDLAAALRGDGPWFEARYHWSSLVHEVIHPFRAFWYGCVNLYHYIPIIWYDRDWDHHYMFVLWEKKFARMAYLFEHYGHHVGDKETAQRLRVCASLCRRILDDDYAEVLRAEHDKKWGKGEFRFEPSGHRTSTLHIDRVNVLTPEDEKLEREEFVRIMKHGEHQRANDLKYLCETVATYAFGWWD
jgi:hypothetical protein